MKDMISAPAQGERLAVRKLSWRTLFPPSVDLFSSTIFPSSCSLSLFNTRLMLLIWSHWISSLSLSLLPATKFTVLTQLKSFSQVPQSQVGSMDLFSNHDFLFSLLLSHKTIAAWFPWTRWRQQQVQQTAKHCRLTTQVTIIMMRIILIPRR